MIIREGRVHLYKNSNLKISMVVDEFIQNKLFLPNLTIMGSGGNLM